MIDNMHPLSLSRQNTIVLMVVAAILVMPLWGADEAQVALFAELVKRLTSR
jgi:hypothetical protein